MTGRYHPFKYTLKERDRPAVELQVQPCIKKYRWEADYQLNNYRLVQFHHVSLGSMLTVWERKKI